MIDKAVGYNFVAGIGALVRLDWFYFLPRSWVDDAKADAGRSMQWVRR